MALMTITGRSERTEFRSQVIKPLVAIGLLEMTIPDKPRWSKQCYRLTQAGTEYLKRTSEKG